MCDEESGNLKGISRNKLRIAVVMDKENSAFISEGAGKPSQKRTFETFDTHIASLSTLIHDKESAHKSLWRNSD